jgi:hypothetical protein
MAGGAVSWRVSVALGLTAITLLTPTPSGLAAPAVITSGLTRDVLGQQDVASFPPQPVNILVSEGMVSPDVDAVTHSHGMGWLYVVQGAHMLTVAGRRSQVDPGTAAWIPDGVEHTHDWNRPQPHKFWFISIGTSQPASVPEGFRLIGTTAPVQTLGPRSHTVELRRYTQTPNPAAASGTAFGDDTSPKVIVLISGTAVVIAAGTPAPPGQRGHPALPSRASQRLGPEQVVLLEPKLQQGPGGHALFNVGAQPYTALVMLLVPK